MDEPANLKPYFQVPRPAHFRARGDVVEELCIPEFMRLNLPRDKHQYEAWLRAGLLKPADISFAELLRRRGQACRPTIRYVFQSVFLPGEAEYANIVTDGNRWVVRTERGGLFEFIQARAVELAMHHGVSETDAWRMLRVKKAEEILPHRQNTPWAIGYECGTGLCTLLAVDFDETVNLYLANKPGYYTPFTEEFPPF